MDKAAVLDFFRKYVLGWMCSDIENCIKAKANFAVAALLMTYTENTGALIEGHLGLTGTSEKDFNTFLEYFDFKTDSNYYRDFKIKYQDSNSSAVQTANIYKAFRCGLIHEYAPKFPCAIENHSDNIDHFTENDPGIGWCYPAVSINFTSYSGSSGYMPQTTAAGPFLRFHTNAYFRDFKNALSKIFEKISVQQNQILINNVQTSLDRVLGRKIIP